LLPIVFILMAVFIRIIPYVPALHQIPHLANFTPVAAIALFSGFYLNRKYSLFVALGAMLISDLIIGFYNPVVMASVYGSFILIGTLGIWLKKHHTIGNLVITTLFGSIIFFLITNFAVWAFPGSFVMYPKTWQGLIDCYIMGLPFFRNTALGDLFYVGALFGAYELVNMWITKRRGNWQFKSKI